MEKHRPFDFLSLQERDLVHTMMTELATVPWAQTLIAAINENGGLVAANKGRMFELRFGHALHQAGVSPRYEIPGEGDSTLDFGFAVGGQSWAVELMRLEETQAARDATFEGVDPDGTTWFGRHLYTSADDPRQSIEGETLKAVQRICQKCEKGGRPYKFPMPQGTYHAILVDMGGFLNQGGDEWDRRHIGFGAKSVPLGCRMLWDGKPVTGVFDAETSVRGAAEARQRVHFIGFVNEPMRATGEFCRASQFVANPSLFSDSDAVRAAIATWPLQPALVL